MFKIRFTHCLSMTYFLCLDILIYVRHGAWYLCEFGLMRADVGNLATP